VGGRARRAKTRKRKSCRGLGRSVNAQIRSKGTTKRGQTLLHLDLFGPSEERPSAKNKFSDRIGGGFRGMGRGGIGLPWPNEAREAISSTRAGNGLVVTKNSPKRGKGPDESSMTEGRKRCCSFHRPSGPSGHPAARGGGGQSSQLITARR